MGRNGEGIHHRSGLFIGCLLCPRLNAQCTQQGSDPAEALLEAAVNLKWQKDPSVVTTFLQAHAEVQATREIFEMVRRAEVIEGLIPRYEQLVELAESALAQGDLQKVLESVAEAEKLEQQAHAQFKAAEKNLRHAKTLYRASAVMNIVVGSMDIARGNRGLKEKREVLALLNTLSNTLWAYTYSNMPQVEEDLPMACATTPQPRVVWHDERPWVSVETAPASGPQNCAELIEQNLTTLANVSGLSRDQVEGWLQGMNEVQVSEQRYVVDELIDVLAADIKVSKRRRWLGIGKIASGGLMYQGTIAPYEPTLLVVSLFIDLAIAIIEHKGIFKRRLIDAQLNAAPEEQEPKSPPLLGPEKIEVLLGPEQI